MKIDVTHMVDDADEMCMLSGSIAELGADAAKRTWNNAVAYGKERPLLSTEEERNAARKHMRGYGAWRAETIAEWSEDELQGVICQDVAAAIREMQSARDYDDYREGVEAGRYSGRLFRGDNGRWYFELDE